MGTYHRSPSRFPAYLVGVFVLFTIMIVLLGYVYYATLKDQFREDKADDLVAVADLKASEIEAWRRERLNDAAFIFCSTQIASEINEITSRTELPFKPPAWMSSMYGSHQYASIRLLSPTGESLCILHPEGLETALSEEVMGMVRGAAAEKRVLLSNLSQHENGGTRMWMVVPQFHTRRGDSLLVGTVVIGIDPEKFLYPLIESWPTSSASAEVLLVAVERDSVVFLNRVRHRPERAFTLRMSIRDPRLPAAMVARGLGHVVDGADYRGVPVLAALRPISNSNWFLVAKLDLDEVYAPVRERAWFVAILAGALILATALAMLGLWRNQTARLYRKQYEAEVSRKALAAHYNYLTKYANDVILLMDDSGNILDANERAENLYGYGREKLLRLNLRDLTGVSDARIKTTWNDAGEAAGTIFETTHCKKDGSLIAVEVSARAIDVEGKWFHQGIIRDITQRKQHEAQIARLNRIYAVLSEVNQTIVRTRNQETLFREVCSILVSRGSMRLAWVGTVDMATRSVVVRAFDGVEDGYLAGIRLSIEDDEHGRGPAGLALRSRRPSIVNDIATDPGFRPWREAALQRGYQSAAAFPLLQGDEPVGVLVLYAPEVGFFNAEEVVLLEEIAVDVAFAARSIEQENQRRQAETDSRESEARFRAMYENAGIGIVLIDEKGALMESNLAYQATLGYTNEELRDMELSDLVHPDDREEDRRLFRELITGSKLLYQLEKRYVRKDGRIIWGGVTVSVVRNDDGKPLYAIGMLRDITERRRAVELLAKTEERFSKVFHASPIAIGIGRLSDGRFIDVNDSFTQLMGFSREEVIGRTGAELGIWADTVARTQTMNKLKAERSVHSEEIVLKTKKNEKLDVHASFEIVDISGEPCMLGLLEDISERKRAENELRNAEEKYRSMFDSAGEGIYQSTPDGRFVAVNLTFARILGYRDPEDLMTSITSIEQQLYGNPEDRAKLKERLAIEGFVEGFETELRRKDGTKIWVSENARRVKDVTGSILYYEGFVQDITERKRAGDRLRESEKSLRESQLIARLGSYVLDIPTGIWKSSEVLDSIFGIDDIYTRSVEGWISLIHPDWRDVMLSYFSDEVLAKQIRFDKEYKIIRQNDGEELWVHGVGKLEFDAQHRPIKMIGTIIDITERKQAEEKLQEAEARYRALFEQSPDGVLLMDIETGKTIEANETAGKQLGYTREEFTALRISDYEASEKPEETAKHIQKVIREGSDNFETLHRTKTGEMRNVHVWAKTLQLNGRVLFYTLFQDITERKRAEKALEQSEIELRVILESTADGILAVDNEGKVFKTNKRFKELWRIPQTLVDSGDDASLLSFVLDQLISPEEFLSKVKLLYDSTDEDMDTLYFKDGRVFERFSTPLSMRGSLAGRVWSFRDITERHRAEEQLQKSVIEYRNLFEGANDAIIIFEPVDEIILEANGKACKMYGFPRHELVGMSLKKITKNVARGEQQIQELLRGGDFHNFETVHLRKDGTPIDMLVSASVIEYTGRKAIQIINRDITDWKRAQEKLRQLSSAVEQSPVSIIITDTKGAIEYINPRFTQVTGYTYAETIGKNPRILKSGNQMPEEYARLWGTITAGKEWRGEFLNKKKNGELYWEFASVSPIKDESGAITHFLAVKEDITERKSLERQFRQAQKLESIGTLAGGIAHDFNNILGIILGHSALLRRVVDDRLKMEKSIGSIESAVHRGAGLVRQILTFARKTDVAFEQVNVNETISELQKMLEETFPKTIVLSVHFDQPLCIIQADRTQLHQTLLNLCVNARDAMPDGGTIAIKISQIPGEQVRRRFMEASNAFYVCITVSDSGSGMDESTRQRVFEPFFTTKEKGKGTGLGLAVVFGIMQGHHGFIDLESEVGTGTTFRLYFPLPTASIEPSNGEASVPDAVAGGNETILLVEDEEMLRELARTLLETHGYKVIVASNGDEAVQRYEESRGRIDLVVSDIGLPRLSGDAVFRKLKATNPQVSVILASGYIEPGVRSALFREGVQEIVQKPYEPTDFLRKIRETLDGRAQK